MSQEQSLNEDVVFTEIPKSSPMFYHCERERHALESLLCKGPGAFYTRLHQENLEPFLSPQEVTQFYKWVQDYPCGTSVPEVVEDDVAGDSRELDFSVQYWPLHSDTSVPSLELGWPERVFWTGETTVNIYISPPAPKFPPVREVVRRLIQGAQKVIAVVTDRLTDNTVISDLHAAASKGVPVYIILNHRFSQESSISHKLKHQNIRVRMLGGRSFCSRDGKMVTGELKENFLLVDVEKVMTGNYSLTWADAHLHRQLVMVLTGPVAISFDQEFRILYAASLPIPNTWVDDQLLMKEEMILPECAETQKCAPTHSQLQPPFTNSSRSMSPLPPASFHDWEVDWEALGVTKYHCVPDETVNPLEELVGPQQHLSPLTEVQNLAEEKNDPNSERALLDNGETSPKDKESQYRPHFVPNPSDVTERLTCNLCNHNNEFASKVENQGVSSSLKKDEGTTPLPFDPRDSMVPRSGPQPWAEPGVSSKSNELPVKKPLILRVPMAENNSSSILDNVLKRLQSCRHSLAESERSERPTLSEMSKSTQDLSHFDKESSAYHLQTSVRKSYSSARETPAVMLMRQHTDEVKSGVCRPTRSFLSPSRLLKSNMSFSQDWKQPSWAPDQGTEKK